MPAAKYTPEQRAEAIALYETHGPTAVQEQLGIAKGTVTGWAKEAGVRTVRTSRTREATEARSADLALMRSAAEAAELEILRWEQEKVLAVKNGSAVWRTVLKGAGGSEHTEDLDFIPPNDARAAHGGRQSVAVTVAKLHEANAASADSSSGAVSVIDKLMAGFAQAYEAGK